VGSYAMRKLVCYPPHEKLNMFLPTVFPVFFFLVSRSIVLDIPLIRSPRECLRGSRGLAHVRLHPLEMVIDATFSPPLQSHRTPSVTVHTYLCARVCAPVPLRAWVADGLRLCGCGGGGWFCVNVRVWGSTRSVRVPPLPNGLLCRPALRGPVGTFHVHFSSERSARSPCS